MDIYPINSHLFNLLEFISEIIFFFVFVFVIGNLQSAYIFTTYLKYEMKSVSSETGRNELSLF